MAPLDDWPVPDPACYYGLAGEVVNTLLPHTEADPMALLLDFLICAGNAIGPGPGIWISDTRQELKLFGLFVGESAMARKGTARNNIRSIMEIAVPQWAEHHVISGLASGQGLIAAVAGIKDPADAFEPEGTPPDKRCLIVETEFVRVLEAGNTNNSILSAVLRDAYDRAKLENRTKKDPIIVDNAFVSIIGHITVGELNSAIRPADLTNGYANRFLMACVRRSKKLPLAPRMPDEERKELGRKVDVAIAGAAHIRDVGLTPGARDLYVEIYNSFDDRTNDPLVVRATGHIVRLSLLFAVLDGQREIDRKHVEAAQAIWNYCEASLAHIFSSVSHETVDELYRAIDATAGDGITKTELYRQFGNNLKRADLDKQLEHLMRKGDVVYTEVKTMGRPKQLFRSARNHIDSGDGTPGGFSSKLHSADPAMKRAIAAEWAYKEGII